MSIKKDYTIGSGNVFADLQRQNPDEQLAKAELARQINFLIQAQELSQVAAAELLGIDQPKVSALSTGKLTGFSLERLFRFLNILGYDITIKVDLKAEDSKAHVNVCLPRIKKRTPVNRALTSSIGLYAQRRKNNKAS